MRQTAKNNRQNKDAILRTRCHETFKARMYRMSATLDKDISDIIREACAEKLLKFEQSLASMSG